MKEREVSFDEAMEFVRGKEVSDSWDGYIKFVDGSSVQIEKNPTGNSPSVVITITEEERDGETNEAES